MPLGITFKALTEKEVMSKPKHSKKGNKK